VLVHGSDRERSAWQIFAMQLMDQGYATLAIDLRGHGESGGEAGDVNTTGDVLAAVDFLRAQAEVDPENIVIIGGNDGAWWALDAASKQPDIRAVALLTPGIRYDKKLLEQVMADYGDRPIFIAVSDSEANHDENAVKTARALDDLATGPHQLEILHDYGWGSGLLMQENGLAPKLLAWLQQTTGN
jgi:pimeloyl-ACP methyl ester carboxylesterase